MRTDVTAFREETSMLMSVIEEAQSAPAYPELADKRILITGITSDCGIDIARAFADHKTRLVLQFAEASESMQAIVEIAAPTAVETVAFGPIGAETDKIDAICSARRAVVPAVSTPSSTSCRLPPLNSKVRSAWARSTVWWRIGSGARASFSSIAANRMSVTLTEGCDSQRSPILATPARGRHQALAAVIKGGRGGNDAAAGRGMGGQSHPFHMPSCRRRCRSE